MKKLMTITVLASVAVPMLSAADVLFQDTFNRADSNDLNASATGKSGIYSAAQYVEVTDNLTTNDALTNIGGNRLSLADGNNASDLHISQNFAVSEITSAGGFRVKLSGLSNDGTNNGEDFFVGFGVGISAAETGAYGFDFSADAVTPGLRGGKLGGAAGSGVSDWFLSLSRANGTNNQRLTFEIWENGVRVASYATDDNLASYLTGNEPDIWVDFAVTSFAAGATVTPTIHAGDRTWGSGDDLSFTWSDADSNFIGLAGRENGAGWSMDGFSIETIPEPATLGLVAAYGAAVLFIRRRLLI